MILDARYSAEKLGCERVHRHDYSVVAAVESGILEMTIAGQRVSLENGMIGFIPAGVAHGVVSTSKDFTSVHVLSLACPYLLTSEGKVMKDTLAEDRKRHRQFLGLMRKYYEASDRRRAAITRSIFLLLEQCGVYVNCKLRKESLPVVHWVPSRIKAMIDSGADTGACFQYIEEQMPFSKEHCNRLFKKSFGTTIQAYVLDARTERARLLLKKGLTVSDSVAESDFYDQSQLTRAFRSTFQLTPAEYRKQVQGIPDQSDTRKS